MRQELDQFIHSGDIGSARILVKSIEKLDGLARKIQRQACKVWLKDQLRNLQHPITIISTIVAFCCEINWLQLELMAFILELYSKNEDVYVLWLASFIAHVPTKHIAFFVDYTYLKLDIDTWPKIVEKLIVNQLGDAFLEQLASHALIRKSNLALFEQINAYFKAKNEAHQFADASDIELILNKLRFFPNDFKRYLAHQKITCELLPFVDHFKVEKNAAHLATFIAYFEGDLSANAVAVYDVLDPEQMPLLLEAIGRLIEEKLVDEAWIDFFCTYTIEDFNLDIFNQLLLLKNIKFPDATVLELPIHLQNRVTKLSNMCLKDRLQICLIMRQLTRQPGDIAEVETEDSVDSAALFVLAAIKEEKKACYPYHPTLLHRDQFSIYLKTLKNSPVSESQRFILAGSHFISGEIEILEDVVNLLLLDSLKIPHQKYITTCREVFVGKKINIFISNTKRQHDFISCSIFALDDIRRLCTRFQYSDQSIFDYLRSHVTETIAYDERMSLYACTLPATMLRATQSTGALQEGLLYADELVNKKRETYREVIASTFFQEGDRLINKRTVMKLKKHAERVERFILEKGYEKAALLAQEHTLAAFISMHSAPPGLPALKRARYQNFFIATDKAISDQNKIIVTPQVRHPERSEGSHNDSF